MATTTTTRIPTNTDAGPSATIGREPFTEGDAMSPVLQAVLISSPAVIASVAALVISVRDRARSRRAIVEIGEEFSRISALLASLGSSSSRVSEDERRPAGPRLNRRADGPNFQVPPLIAVPDLAPPAPSEVAIPEELVRRFGAIWEMADGGASPSEIARNVGLPIGQVELILGLRNPGKPRRPGTGKGQI